MPRVSCWDADEIRWVNWQAMPHPNRIQLGVVPAKGVLKLIEKIEAGELLPVLVDPDTDYLCKESVALHEAYIRCHVSVIPTVYKEKKRDANRDPMPAPIEDEDEPF